MAAQTPQQIRTRRRGSGYPSQPPWCPRAPPRRCPRPQPARAPLRGATLAAPHFHISPPCKLPGQLAPTVHENAAPRSRDRSHRVPASVGRQSQACPEGAQPRDPIFTSVHHARCSGSLHPQDIKTARHTSGVDSPTAEHTCRTLSPPQPRIAPPVRYSIVAPCGDQYTPGAVANSYPVQCAITHRCGYQYCLGAVNSMHSVRSALVRWCGNR